MRILQETMNPEVEKKLLEAERSPDLEISRRAEILLRPYYQRIAGETVQKLKEACGGKFPWADMDDHGEAMQQFKFDASEQNGPPEWASHRSATERYLLEVARARGPVQEILERMKQRQNQWVEQYRQNFSQHKLHTY